MEAEPVIVSTVFFMTIVVIWGSIILTRHKERITLIEKGLKAEDIKALYERGARRTRPMASLMWGMVFVGIGLAAIIGIWLNNVYNVGDGVIPALMALFGGVGLIAFYLVAAKKARE
jgi:hypothetical protein